VPFQRNTSLVIAFSNEDIPRLEAIKRQGEQNGVEGLKIINRDEVLKREPNISQKVCCALLVPSGGIVCPYELTQAYAENAAENGAIFFRNQEVISVDHKNNEWSVKTKDKEFLAKAVVNAAGVHSDEINNMASKNKLKITPRRGEYYLVDKTYAESFKATIFQLPTKMGKGTLVAPTVDGTILIGPTAEDIEDKDDTRTTRFGLDKALASARLTWEDIPVRDFIATFSGIRSHSETSDFVIGEAEDAPFFFNAAGIESPGLTSSPAIAAHLAEEISNKLNSTKNKDFNPIRKSLTKFRDMTNEERAEAILTNPDYAKIVCRCENITEAEIRQSIRRPVGARSVDGVKLRTRAGMGRCQAGFCTSRVVEILSEELKVPVLEVTKCGGNSCIVTNYLFSKEGKTDA
jgi:glycerol-3-phosphate dehydrogenase